MSYQLVGVLLYFSILTHALGLSLQEPPTNLEAFLLPDEMEHMPDMFVLGTQESGGSRTEWEVRTDGSCTNKSVIDFS